MTLFVVIGRGRPYLRQPCAARRIDAVDHGTAGLRAPAVTAGPYTGVHFAQSEDLEGILAMLQIHDFPALV